MNVTKAFHKFFMADPVIILIYYFCIRFYTWGGFLACGSVNQVRYFAASARVIFQEFAYLQLIFNQKRLIPKKVYIVDSAVADNS